MHNIVESNLVASLFVITMLYCLVIFSKCVVAKEGYNRTALVYHMPVIIMLLYYSI